MGTDRGLDLQLDGKVALITGGTRGLGRSIGRRLCVSGCTVILNYAHSTTDADDAVRSMDGLRGRAATARADVSSGDAFLDLLGRIAGEFGKLDIFIHNAATFNFMSPLQPATDEFHRVHALTLNPLVYGSHRLAGMMPRGSRIVAISSNGARETIPGYMGLGVAKAALESLVRYLAVDLGPAGITVNAVATGMLDKEGDTPRDPAVAPIARLLAERTPNGRLTQPDDVAGVVALLCTPEAGWLQGQVLMADGGLSLRA